MLKKQQCVEPTTPILGCHFNGKISILFWSMDLSRKEVNGGIIIDMINMDKSQFCHVIEPRNLEWNWRNLELNQRNMEWNRRNIVSYSFLIIYDIYLLLANLLSSNLFNF